ncbi:MAG: T9SS type A sorting domain-containing protein [Bacteroidota bacterium]
MKHTLATLVLFCSFGNAQWARVSDVPASSRVYTLFAVNDTLYAGTDSLMYFRANAGTQWTSHASPVTGPDAISCMAKTKNVLMAGTFKGGIFTSTDEGASWQAFDAGLSGLGSMDIGGIVMLGDSLMAGTLGAGVFVTANDLTHPWSSLSDSLAPYQGENVFKILGLGNVVLASAGSNGYMFRYTNAEPWWNPVPLSTPRHVGLTVSGIASSASTVVAGTSSGVYRSTDEGLSWNTASVSFPPQTTSILLMRHGGTFFMLANTLASPSLLISQDEGVTWQPQGSLPVPFVHSLTVVAETLYLGTTAGLWSAPLSGVVAGVEGKTTLPPAFHLGQSYPNPFNPSTRIPFSVESQGVVSLKVYDLLGREVKTLVDEYLQPGDYERTFDASGFAGGVYLYRLRSTGFLETRRVLLLK